MTDRPSFSSPDALTDILRSVRMQGAVFSKASLGTPWGVESGDFPTGVFHAVVSGSMHARLAGTQETTTMRQGDVVFIPHGHNHVLGSHPDSPTQLIGELTTTDETGMGHLIVAGAEPTTALLCGTVSFESETTHPIFSMLPPMLHIVDSGGRLSQAVQTLIHLIAEELERRQPGTETVVARHTDALVVYLLRAYVNGLEPGEGGWLGGLKDPRIAAALGHIHRTADQYWTVGDLAAASGMSRSGFFSLFRELVGDSPMDYLTRWRMHLASQLLRSDGCSVAETARQVGYATETGFSNAFVRTMGVRPGTYRRGKESLGRSQVLS